MKRASAQRYIFHIHILVNTSTRSPGFCPSTLCLQYRKLIWEPKKNWWNPHGLFPGDVWESFLGFMLQTHQADFWIPIHAKCPVEIGNGFDVSWPWMISCLFQIDWIRSQGFGGVMVWALDLDDFTGTCGTGRWPLMETISHKLGRPVVQQIDYFPASVGYLLFLTKFFFLKKNNV